MRNKNINLQIESSSSTSIANGSPKYLLTVGEPLEQIIRRGDSCLDPVKGYVEPQQPIFRPNLMLEINFGNQGGAPIAIDHAVWGYLQHVYSSALQPQKIVLISETKMCERYPDEYRQFLVKLREMFPSSSFYYMGRANNYTVSETDEDEDCYEDFSAQRVVLWGGDVHANIRMEKSTNPQLPWHFVTHCFNNTARKKQNIRQVLGITEKKNPTEYNQRVFLHSPEEIATWLIENAATRVQAFVRGYFARLYVATLEQQLLAEVPSANCMPIFLMVENLLSSLFGTADAANKSSDEGIKQPSMSIFKRGGSSIVPIPFDSMDDEEHKEEKNEADFDERTHNNLLSPNMRLMS